MQCDEDLAVVFVDTSLLIELLDRHPELLLIIFIERDLIGIATDLLHLCGKILFEVCLMEHHPLLRINQIFPHRCKVQVAAADDVVVLDYVSVNGLNSQVTMLCLVGKWNQETVVEATLAVLATPVSIRLVHLVGVEASSDLNVTRALYVHGGNTSRSPDDYSDFVISQRTRVHINGLSLRVLAVFLVDLDPHLEHTLSDSAGRMVQVAELNGTVVHRLPRKTVVTVIKINLGLANQFVTKETVLIVGLDLKHGSAREVRIEVIVRVEIGTVGIQLVVLSVVDDFVA